MVQTLAEEKSSAIPTNRICSVCRLSHFDKERQLFKRGIKCLSLFFIDEVAKYKSYDEEGNEVKDLFQKMFKEGYSRLVSNEFHIWDDDYNEYLRRFYSQDVYLGYFSIDKKTNRVIDGKVEKKTRLSDDISATSHLPDTYTRRQLRSRLGYRYEEK